MVRQAHTYLVGAMSGATLIAVAIVVFVLLVSAQVFRDWPIASLGDGDDSAVSSSQPVDQGGAVERASKATGPGAGTAATTVGKPVAQAKTDTAGQAVTRPSPLEEVSGEGPIASPAIPARGEDPAPSSGAQNPSAGADPQPQPVSSQPQESGSTGSTGSTGNSNSGNSSSGSGGGKTAAPTKPSTSGTVTSTVNETVNQVDETVTGGALGATGATGATEGVVEGVVGPESPVGKTVDETVGTVGGVVGGLGGKR